MDSFRYSSMLNYGVSQIAFFKNFYALQHLIMTPSGYENCKEHLPTLLIFTLSRYDFQYLNTQAQNLKPAEILQDEYFTNW